MFNGREMKAIKTMIGVSEIAEEVKHLRVENEWLKKQNKQLIDALAKSSRSEAIERIREAALYAEKLGAGMWITPKGIHLSLRRGFLTTMRDVSFKDIEHCCFNPLKDEIMKMEQQFDTSPPAPAGEEN